MEAVGKLSKNMLTFVEDLLRAFSSSCFVYGFVCLVICEKTMCGKDFTSYFRYFHMKKL